MPTVPVPTLLENQNAEQHGPDQMKNMSSIARNNQEKSLNALNHTQYDVLKDAGISMVDSTHRNHKSTHDQSNDCWDGYHVKQYENGDMYSGYFNHGEISG